MNWRKAWSLKRSLLTLLTIALLVLFLSLSQWQFNRAKYKQDLLDQQQQRRHETPIVLTDQMTTLQGRRYLPVRIEGSAEPEHQFMLDNQILQGRVGYFVLLPVRLESGVGVLVNRGWVAGHGDRAQLPEIGIEIEMMRGQGYLDAFPSVGMRLSGAEVPESGWPSMLQLVDPEQIAKKLGYPVMPYQVVLDMNHPASLTPIPRAMPMGPEKHYGYAVQWAALAFTLVVIYGWLSFRQPDDENEANK
jgi:surfeit locus 1 family protein